MHIRRRVTLKYPKNIHFTCEFIRTINANMPHEPAEREIERERERERERGERRRVGFSLSLSISLCVCLRLLRG